MQCFSELCLLSWMGSKLRVRGWWVVEEREGKDSANREGLLSNTKGPLEVCQELRVGPVT